MVIVMIDTREPAEIFEAARKTDLQWTRMTLTYGDFASEHVIWERKHIQDLVQSIYTKRLEHQLENLYKYCQPRGKVAFLFVHGKIKELEKQFAARGQKLNPNAIIGAVASVLVRYDCNVFWSEQPMEEALKILWKICEKVEEGKLGIPRRKDLKTHSYNRRVAVFCHALRIGPKLATRLVKKFNNLYNFVIAMKEHPEEVLVIEGVGPATFRKLKMMVGLE